MKDKIRSIIADGKAIKIDDLIDRIASVEPAVYASDVKATLLGMISRNELVLNENFEVQRPLLDELQ